MGSLLENLISLLSLAQKSSFSTTWSDDKTRYQRLSTIAFVSVCDWHDSGIMKYSMNGPNARNICGTACLLLKKGFDGTFPDGFEAYSKTDHVNMVAMTTGRDHTVQSSSEGDVKANIFYSFRGTFIWDIVNMRRNKHWSFTLVSMCDQCAAHSGMYKNFISIRYSILQTLLKAEKAPVANGLPPQVIMIGMSMGGVLANYAGLYLRERTSKNIHAIYTFGSPRAGNHVMKSYMSQIDSAGGNHQFVMYRDIIPHLAPRIFGFRHMASTIYWLYVDPVYFAKIARGEDPEYTQYLSYKEFTGVKPDSDWADSLHFFDVSDHDLYFLGLNEESISACGGFADRFLKNLKGTALFL